MWKRLFLITLIIGSVLLAGAPYALQYGIQKFLLSNGAKKVEIPDIDLNPFTGELLISDLAWVTRQGQRQTLQQARINIDWQPLTRYRLLIRTLRIEGLSMDIATANQGTAVLAGFSVPASGRDEHTPSKWRVALKQATISNTNLRITTPKAHHTVFITRARISEIVPWFPGDNSSLELLAKIDGTPLSINTRFTPFKNRPHYQLDLDIKQFDLSTLHGLLPALQPWKGEISVHSKLDITQSHDTAIVQHRGQISARNILIEQDGITASANALSLHGETRYIYGQRPAWTTQSTITFDTLHIQDKVHALTAHIARLALSGKGHYTTEDQAGFTAQMNIKLAELALTAAKNFRLLEIKDATLTHAAINKDGKGGHAQAQQLALQHITVAKDMDNEKTSLFKADTLTLTPVSFAGNHLHIKQASVIGGHTRIQRHADNTWNFERLSQVIKSITATEQTSVYSTKDNTPASSMQTAITFDIERLTFGRHHTLLLDDKKMVPPFLLKSVFKELSIENIDNRQANHIVTLNLTTTLEKYSELNLFGKLKPFQPALSGKFKAQIQNLDLPVFSSYMAPALGVQIKSGLLTSKVDLNIQDNTLNGMADITLQQFTLGNLTQEQKQFIKEGADLSLNKALDILRDKNNRIQLKLPISGDMRSPEFAPGDAIRQAARKAARVGAIKYLTQALQPYGSMITVARIAGEQLTKIRLAPIKFPAGSSILSEEARDYMQKVARILVKRPQLAVRLCGFATYADQPNEEKEEYGLSMLAQERASEVEGYLLNTLHTQKKQLVGCLPEIDKHNGAVGRVELFI